MMSGFTPIPDPRQTSHHVRKVPEAAIEPDLRLALAKPRFR
jgi:hypothetical protein